MFPEAMNNTDSILGLGWRVPRVIEPNLLDLSIDVVFFYSVVLFFEFTNKILLLNHRVYLLISI